MKKPAAVSSQGSNHGMRRAKLHVASLNSVIASAFESPAQLPLESSSDLSMGRVSVRVKPGLRDRFSISYDEFLWPVGAVNKNPITITELP